MAVCKFYQQGNCRYGGTYHVHRRRRRRPLPSLPFTQILNGNAALSLLSHFHDAHGKLPAPPISKTNPTQVFGSDFFSSHLPPSVRLIPH